MQAWAGKILPPGDLCEAMYEVRPGRVFTGARCGGGWGAHSRTVPSSSMTGLGPTGRCSCEHGQHGGISRTSWHRTGGVRESWARSRSVHESTMARGGSVFRPSSGAGPADAPHRMSGTRTSNLLGTSRRFLVRNPPALCRSSPTCIDFYVARNQNFSVRPGMQKSVVLKG